MGTPSDSHDQPRQRNGAGYDETTEHLAEDIGVEPEVLAEETGGSAPAGEDPAGEDPDQEGPSAATVFRSGG